MRDFKLRSGFCIAVILFFHSEICVCDILDYSSEDREQYCIQRNSEAICNHIPESLQRGTRKVELRNINSHILRNGSFSSPEWGHISQLDISADEDWLLGHDTIKLFDSSCFKGLQNLEILRIGISDDFKFTSQTLRGLDNLKVLDVSKCRRFYLDNFISSLNQSDLVPNLQTLNLSSFNTYRDGLRLTNPFFKILSEKNITKLDMSSTDIDYVNVTSFFENCNSLVYLNVSRVKLSLYDNILLDTPCRNLKYIDVSYSIPPSFVLSDYGPTWIVSNRTVTFNVNWISLRNLRYVEFLNVTALLVKRTRYSLKNVTANIFGADELRLKTLIFRDNYLDRIDAKLNIPKCPFEKIDLTGCGMSFLSPYTLSAFSLLTWIDLSRNNLHKMMEEDCDLFGKMFRNLSQLRYTGLAANGLSDLPRDVFKTNLRLKHIDLSSNRLTRLTFGVAHISKLEILNLEYNMIKTIDIMALKHLDTVQIRLKGNPISCSRCDSLDFIRWILTSNSTKKTVAELKCHNDKSEIVSLNEDVIDKLQELCIRPKIIIISCGAGILTVLVGVVALIAIRQYRRQQKYQLVMKDRIALIRKGARSHEFVVFLSYSSFDDEFISSYVYPTLNDRLQDMIGEGRDLVCEGDRNFQLGKPISDQISVLLKRSSVVVVLLTDNYSLSVHCRNEFDQAFMLEKPIVLMIKDHVNTDLMTPLIRDLYEKKTRILWMYENGQYVLKTSWENVCTSIVELVNIK